MLLKTILNKTYRFKSFIYGNVKLSNNATCIEVDITPRMNSKAICSICGEAAPIHQTDRHARRFEFIPLWAMKVIFLYCM